jgi:cyclic-di-GMP-binding protein
MPIKLSLPETGETLQLKAETRPRRVKAWLEALPLANIVEAARSVSDALISLNRTPLEIENRLKLLELYTAAINNLVPELEHKYTMVALPLPEKSRQAANLARRLYVELAYGYKIILLDRLQKKRLRIAGRAHLHLLIQRAMDALSKALGAFYKTYSPAPPGMWSEIHQLAQLALQRKLHDEPLDGGRNSISSTYKRALLLGLANPYKLMQGEVEKVTDYLVRQGNLAKLYPMQDKQNASGVFVINLDSDAPPKSLEQDTKTTMHNHILLGTDALVSALEDDIARLEAANLQKALSLPDHTKQVSYVSLLRRLGRDWTFMPKRKFQRMNNNAPMEICVGLRATCHYISAQPESAEQRALDFRIDTIGGSTGTAKSERAHFATSQWAVTNESAGGMGLKSVTNITQPIRIGEIIGLRSEDSRIWNIGVVRRVFTENSDNVELGVQMLAPTATAVTIKPVVAGPKETFQAALLLPELRPLQQPATIVAAPATFRSKLEYLLYMNGVVSHVRAMRLVDQTASFDQFQFSIE